MITNKLRKTIFFREGLYKKLIDYEKFKKIENSFY